jgi:hypothetical protein
LEDLEIGGINSNRYGEEIAALKESQSKVLEKMGSLEEKLNQN